MILVRSVGQCVIDVDDTPITPESEVVFALLLYLASHAGRTLPRRALVDLLWPTADDLSARHCLRQTLYRLRRLGVPLRATAESVTLSADVVSLAHDALQVQIASGDLRLPDGAYLPGYLPRLSAPFAEWVEHERALVHGEMRRVLMAAISEARVEGRYADVERLARACLALDPLNEEATLALAEATATTGSKTDALVILDRYLAELGSTASDRRVPVLVLRRRITERLPAARYGPMPEAMFVGRDAPLAELTALWNESRLGTCRSCLVWGEAGIGKTRLATEFAKIAIVQGTRVERAASQATGIRRPLALFVELVPRLLNLPGALGASPESMSYLRRLTEHDPAAAGPSEDSREATVLYANIRRAIFDLVEAVTEECSLVLHVEDAHWLDAMSWEILAELTRRAARRRLFLLVTSRLAPHAHEVPEAIAFCRGVSVLPLEPLAEESARALIDSVAQRHGAPLADGLRARCVRTGNGNPFFLYELAAHLLGTARPGSLPRTLQVLLEQRLAALSGRALHVLQAIALLRPHATLDRVEGVLEYSAHETLTALEELDAAGLVLIDGPALSSRHELLSEHAITKLGAAGRLVLHRHAALVLQAEVEATRSAALMWDCAAHWEAAGSPEHALRLATLCGDHLLELGLPADAANLFERALAYTRTADEKYDLLGRQLDATTIAGQYDRVVVVVERRRGLRDQQSETANSYHDDDELIELDARRRRFDPNDDLLRRALACIEDKASTDGHRIEVAAFALILVDNTFDAATAHHVFKRVGNAVASRREDTASVARLKLIYHSCFGDLDSATDAGTELVRAARKTSRGTALSRALRWASEPFRRLGQRENAEDLLREALAVSTVREDWPEAGATLDYLGCLAFQHDDLEVAAIWSARLTKLCDKHDVRLAIPRVADDELVSKIALAQGDMQRARAALDNLLSATDSHRWAPRAAVARYATKIAHKLAGGVHELPSETDVERLADLHAQGREFAGHDFQARVLVAALTRLTRHERAARTWDEYLRHRRERYPVPKSIVRMFSTESCEPASLSPPTLDRK